MAIDANSGRDTVHLFPRYAPGATTFERGEVVNVPPARQASASKRGDAELATAVADALQREGDIPDGICAVRVADGVVTLEGRAECHYQRAAVERAVRFLDGVRDVHNMILVQPAVSVPAIRQRIVEALRRGADETAAAIVVQSASGAVDLRGSVRSREERAAVEGAVLAMPGVTAVNNLLIVSA